MSLHDRNVIRLPDYHEGLYLARRVLRSADATPDQIEAALDVLDASNDWMDINLCRQMRRIQQLRPVIDAPAVVEPAPTSERLPGWVWAGLIAGSLVLGWGVAEHGLARLEADRSQAPHAEWR